jgi:adenylate cyclase
MAVWNAPTACADHPRRACEGALSAKAAADALFAAEEWQGRPALVTRFGLHTDEVLVGHFGAPDRMSYTCLGDGVNLAARLEGLNKQYGTSILVSEAVRRDAGDAFAFRFLDVVAVTGKGQAVRVFELLGRAGAEGLRMETARRYEDALALYLRRDFEAARLAFEALVDDPPSAILAARCRDFATMPPPEEWDGTYVSRGK